MSDWEGVSEFVAVVEAGSFTEAAKRLGLSTAQVSRQISALESRLATKLLYRTTRRVSVSEPGQIYYQHCRQVLDGLAEAERAISDLHQTPHGLLKLTAPVTFGETTVAPLINDFAGRYPQLQVDLHLTNQKLDLIADGYDLAIRLGKLQETSLRARRLGSRTLYVCASPAYLASQGEPYTLSELAQHNCLPGTLEYWRFQERKRPRNIKVSGTIRCNSGWALVDAALKGIGIVQLPGYYVHDHLLAGRLISLLEAYREDDDGIWALYPHNRHLSPKVAMFLDYLGEHFGLSSN